MRTEDFYLARDRKRLAAAQRRYEEEYDRIQKIVEERSDSWGDYLGAAAGERFLVGSGRGDGVRVQIFDSWKKSLGRYFPQKHVEYRTTANLRTLRERLVEVKKTAQKNARKRPAYKKAAAAEREAKKIAEENRCRRQRHARVREILRLRKLGCSNPWIRALVDPARAGFVLRRADREMFEGEENWDALRAVDYARDNNSLAWRWYVNGGLDSSDPEGHLIAIALKTQWRHEDTVYDELLEAGLDKESARILMG